MFLVLEHHFVQCPCNTANYQYNNNDDDNETEITGGKASQFLQGEKNTEQCWSYAKLTMLSQTWEEPRRHTYFGHALR